MKAQTRIPGLDGVRALAIASVICVHTNQHNASSVLHAVTAGQDGVGLFFILSGFLVTALLLREHQKYGAINIGHFYFRRAMRIAPPLLSYLFVVVVLQHFRHHPVPWTVITSVLFFFHNVRGDGTWMLEHTWSLAVEEQFYLLWPLILSGVLYISRRATLVLTGSLIALAPILRMAGYLLQWHWLHHRESSLLPTRMDALLCGCIISLLINNDGFESLYRRLEGFAWIAPIFLFVVSPYLSVHFFPAYDNAIGFTLTSIVGAFFILWLSRNEFSFLGRLSNCRPVALIGRASYSIYLWQTLATHTATGSLQIIAGLVFIAAAASTSYYFVERPAAATRAKLEMFINGGRAFGVRQLISSAEMKG